MCLSALFACLTLLELPITAPAAPAKIPAADRDRVMMLNFAYCIIDPSLREVDRTLAMYPGPEQIAKLRRLATGECSRYSRMTFSVYTFLDALRVMRYRRRFRSEMPRIPADKVNFAAVVGMPADYSGFPYYTAQHDFADCVLRADPKAARAFVLAEPASPEERSASAVIAPIFASCVARGQELDTDKLRNAAVLADVSMMNDTAAAISAGQH